MTRPSLVSCVLFVFAGFALAVCAKEISAVDASLVSIRSDIHAIHAQQDKTHTLLIRAGFIDSDDNPILAEHKP